MDNINKSAGGGSMTHEAPLVVRYREMIINVVKDNVADMALQDLTNSGENGYWTVSSD